MQSPDDYDFDDPKYQADLDRLLDRLAARRRADRSRFEDPLSRLVDHIYGNPFVRQRPQEEKPQEPIKLIEKPLPEALPVASTVDELRANLGKQIEKPLPEALPVANTVEELRANLGKRKGTRSKRKVKPIPDKPTLDLKLIEKLFNDGTTIHQIRAALHVGSARFRLEVLTFLPHIAEASTKRRGRKSRLLPALEEEQVKRLRAQGWGWKKIAAELKACHKRLMHRYGEPSSSS